MHRPNPFQYQGRARRGREEPGSNFQYFVTPPGSGPNWNCYSDRAQFSGHMNEYSSDNYSSFPGYNSFAPNTHPRPRPLFNSRRPLFPHPPILSNRHRPPRFPNQSFAPRRYHDGPPPLNFPPNPNQYPGPGPRYPYPPPLLGSFLPFDRNPFNFHGNWDDFPYPHPESDRASRREFQFANANGIQPNFNSGDQFLPNPWLTESSNAPRNYESQIGFEDPPLPPPLPMPQPPPVPPPIPTELQMLPLQNVPLEVAQAPGISESNPIPDENPELAEIAEDSKTRVHTETSDWYKIFSWEEKSVVEEGAEAPTPEEVCPPKEVVKEKKSSSKSKTIKRLILSKKSLPSKSTDDRNGETENNGHGRVQSVKLLSDETGSSPSGGSSGVARGSSSATVSFIDILSASKALRAVPTLSGQPLQITYHETGSVHTSRGNHPVEPSSASPARSLGDSAVTINTDISGTGNSNTPTQNQTPQGNSNGPASGSSSGNSYRQQRFPNQHGPSEDSSSHFYEQPKGFSRGRGDGRAFHGGRGRRENRYHNNRQNFPIDRNYRMGSWGYPTEGRFAPPAHSEPDIERASSGPPPSSHSPSVNTESSTKGPRRPDSPASSVSSRHLPSKRNQSRSVSESGSSDRGSSAGSRSRSGSHSSASSAGSGRSRSPSHHGSASGNYAGSRGGSSSRRIHSHSFPRQSRYRSRLVSRPADSSRIRPSHSSRSPPMDGGSPSSSTSASSSPSPHRKVSTAPHSPSASPSSTKSYSPSRSLNSASSHHHQSHSHRRAPSSAELNSAIKIRNLPARSSDTSLKDGLYHEYKKHGKVSWVRVIGNGPERYAVVCFKSSVDASKAISQSQDKYFFGCKILVSSYQSGGGGGVGSRAGEEPLGGPAHDDNRYLDEDESYITNIATRNVLVAGLDPLITKAELEETLSPYGEIVGLDIRKAVGNTYTVCEYVDIASASKVLWSRLQITNSRICFYRSQPNNSILLDGTSGCSEKLLASQCSQYGAITKTVVDLARSMALVQFEEISAAQAALRELRNWMYKGKQCSLDFATPASIRLFLARIPFPMSDIVGNNSVGSPDLHSDSVTPPLANSGTPSKENGGTTVRRSNGRRFTDFPTERRPPYRHSNDVEAGAGLRIYNDEGVTPDLSLVIRNGPTVGNNVNGTGENTAGGGSYHGRRRFGPVNSDPDNLITEDRPNAGVGKKLNSSGSKIDLSCHETDSAVVTSSSDVIVTENAEPSDHHTQHPEHLQKHRHNILHRNNNLITVNGDDRPHGNFESVGGVMSRSPNIWSKSHYVFGAVDGVSSTSPEPKTETVRKASPDPGAGLDSVNHSTLTETPISPVLSDPRIRDPNSKIRRSSADSGNFSASSKYQKPGTGTGPGYTAEPIPTTPGDDADDRPGTPLCDENPEHFPPSSDSQPNPPPPTAEKQQFGRPVKTDEPLSLPLPEFAHQRHNSVHTRQGSVGGSTSSTGSKTKETIQNSPLVSPCPSVMTSVVSDNSAKSTNVTDNTKRSSASTSGVSESEIKPETPSEISSKPIEFEPKLNSKSPLSIYSSSPSPPLSPNGSNLDLRIKLLYEKYEQWSTGNRTVGRSHSVGLNSTESKNPSESSSGTRLGSYLDKPWFNRKLDFDELRHQPSDITKSLIAKKSIFDEDSKRLENFREKYDSKPPLSSANAANWRLSLVNRSSSTASNSSNSSNPLTPTSATSSASSNVFPSTPTTPVTIFGRSLSHQASNQSPGPMTPSSPKPPPSAPTTASPNLNNQCPVAVKPRKERPLIAKLDPNLNSIAKGSTILPKPTTPASAPPTASAGSKLSSTNSSPSPHFPPPISRSVSSPITLAKPEVLSQKSKAAGVINSPNSTQTNPESKAKVTAPKSAPPPGIHQGIPRMVERSMSLDSKRNLTNSVKPAPQPPPAASAGSSPSNSNGPVSASSTSTIPTLPAATRRTSVDTPTPKESPVTPSPLPTNQITVAAKSENEVSRAKVKPMVVEPVKDWKGATLKEIINNSKSSPALTILTSSTNHAKELSTKFDVIKEETRLNFHHLQEPTVAVVASIQSTPILTPRTSGNSSSSGKDKDKDSSSVSGSKKDRDSLNNNNNNRKRKASGSNTPITNHHNGRPDSSSSSNKGSKEKREKEKGSSSSNGTKEKFEHENSNTNANYHSSSSGSGSHHHKDKKKDKEAKEAVTGSGNAGENLNSNYSHKKDKEASSKAKRRLSSLDTEPDHKKAKVDKEKDSGSSDPPIPPPPPEPHHHRKSSSSASERRESRDSSSSASKDKHHAKDKGHSSVSTSRDVSKDDKPDLIPPATPVKDKPEKCDKEKEKEHHHRSKSTSSSSSKHHHHEKTEKTSSSSSHSHKEKDRQKKEKEKSSPGLKDKESSSKTPSSKHSSSHSSSHHRSKDKEEKPTGTTSSAPSTSSSSSSKSKSKEKEREKIKEKQSSTSSAPPQPPPPIDSDDADDVDGGHEKDKRSSNKSKSSSSSKGRRDRIKSGGDSSGGNDSSKAGSSRGKVKEQKKRRRRVIDETDSSDSNDDDDDKQKHHSIFEVVVDEYVSMYDKVKARSNRACKNVAASKLQQEEQKKQDKVSESFNQLKKSRAKLEEKKRSTSVDDRKSMNTTTDDESHTEREHHHDTDEDLQRTRQPQSDRELDHANTTQSSSDEEPSLILASAHKRLSSTKSKSHSSKSKRKEKEKDKDKDLPSSSSKSGKASSHSGSLIEKRPKKSNKASPLRSSAFFLTHSDDDSSSHVAPVNKKRKLSSKHNTPSLTVVSSMSVDTSKSTDESMSEPEESGPTRNSFLASPPKSSSKKKHSSKPQRKMMSSMEIYSESDSSHTRKTSSSSKSRKDKASKQKSIDLINRQLFDESASSDHEEKEKEKEVKSKSKESSGKTSTRSGKSKEGKESKSSKKKSSSHHSGSGSKTNKRKRDRLSSGDAKSVVSESSTSKAKKESPPPAPVTTAEELFGSFSPSSASEAGEVETITNIPVPIPVVEDEKPPTPTPMISKSFDETPVTSKKSKSSRSRSKPRRSSMLDELSKSVDEPITSQSQVNNGALESTPVQNSHVKLSSSSEKEKTEKKKKKHHKRSKRLESHDSSIRTDSVDLDSLFCSPVHSPEQRKEETPKVKATPLIVTPTTPPALASPSKFPLYPPAEMPLLSLATTPVKSVKGVEDKVSQDLKSMFSTDEEDDDDEALKIDISEAIIASGENEEEDLKPVIAELPVPFVELPVEPVIDEEALAAAKLLEDEEKRRNQDQAIESILMERRSPPRLNTGSLGSIQGQTGLLLEPEDTIKDELTKDEMNISQEETEDAVAALLDTLNQDDEAEEEPSTVIRSPPTLSIPETSPVHESAVIQRDKEILTRPTWFAPSPKELTIDESEISAVISRDRASSMDKTLSIERTTTSVMERAPSMERISTLSIERAPSMERIPAMDRVPAMDRAPSMERVPAVDRVPAMDKVPTPTLDRVPVTDNIHFPPPAPPQLQKKLTHEQAAQELQELLKQARSKLEESELSMTNRSRRQSRQGSGSSEQGSSGDVYDFHDSDDGSPRPPNVLPPPKPNATPPVGLKSPSGPLEIVIDKVATGPIPHQLISPQLQAKLPSPVPKMPTPTLPPVVIKEEVVEVVPEVHPVQPIMQSPRAPSQPASSSISPVARTKTPPTPAPFVRNSVDEIIEEVVRGGGTIRTPDPEVPVTPLPIMPTARSSPRGRGRSMSKDSSDEITATINRVACLDSSPKRPSTGAEPTPVTVASQQPKPKLPIIETRTDSHGPQPTAASEVLIDPQTGHLTQMMRQSDEGQYVPVAGQEPLKVNHVGQMSQGPSFQTQAKLMAVKAGELERAGSIERVQPDPQPYQIQIQKNEGLPAMLAQQQQQMQFQQKQQQELRRKQQYMHQMQQHQAFQQHNQSPGPPTASQSPGGTAGPPTPYHPGKPAATAPSDLPSSAAYIYPAPISSPGQSPPARPPVMYGTPPPHSVAQLPQVQFNQGPLTRPQEPQVSMRLPSPLVRQSTPGPPQHVPSPGQIQAQLVRIPQVPIQTTITKVESRNDEQQQNRMPTIIQHPSNVILTTTSASGHSLSGVPQGASIVRGTNMPAHQLQARVHEGFGSQGPPRIEISGNLVPSSTGSPTTMHRIPSHMPFDPAMEPSTSPAPLDLVTQSSHNSHNIHARSNPNTNSSSTSSKVHQARQADARLIGQVRPIDTSQFTGQQVGYPHHYNIPVTMGVGLPSGAGHGQQPCSNNPYGMRPGSGDPLQQQNIPPPLERPVAHLIPQHMSSPHLGDRSAESPHLVPIYARTQMVGNYGGQGPSHGGQHHSPSIPTAHQQQQMRQTFTHPYDYEDGNRGYAPSPGYNVQEREGLAGRDGSPFNVNARRGAGTPPPAHIVPATVFRHGPAPDTAAQRDPPPPGPQSPPGSPGVAQDNLLILLTRYPIMWQGMLALKNDQAACQFHFVSGNITVARDSLPAHLMPDPTFPPLRISQRMRLEQTQLDGVARKLQTDQEYAMLLALPCGRDHMDVLHQGNNLRNGFITYLQLKQAAGIVNIHQPGSQMPAYVIHIFPSCDFANENLARIAPDLLHGVADIAHLLIVIATV